jgi:hypothetical protein
MFWDDISDAFVSFGNVVTDSATSGFNFVTDSATSGFNFVRDTATSGYNDAVRPAANFAYNDVARPTFENVIKPVATKAWDVGERVIDRGLNTIDNVNNFINNPLVMVGIVIVAGIVIVKILDSPQAQSVAVRAI